MARLRPTPDLLDKLRSNLRGPTGMPLRCVLAANPADVGHQWCASRYVFKAGPWQVFDEPKSQRQFVYAPSTFVDNPFVDQIEYRQQLEASCPSDPELLRAWLEGDWSVARGAYFGAVLDEQRNAVDPWEAIPTTNRYGPWECFVAHDFGSSAPSVTYVVAESPGARGPDQRFYPRGSIVLLDELATHEPNSLTRGMGYTVPVLSEMIIETARRWTGDDWAQGVADDSIFAKSGSGAGSISDEFRRANVFFVPAEKGSRVTGWNVMRRMLQDAGKPDAPGLYIARNCEYFWATVPYLPRDPRRVEDVDSRGPDHGADGCRYALTRERNVVTQRPMFPDAVPHGHWRQ